MVILTSFVRSRRDDRKLRRSARRLVRRRIVRPGPRIRFSSVSGRVFFGNGHPARAFCVSHVVVRRSWRHVDLLALNRSEPHRVRGALSLAPDVVLARSGAVWHLGVVLLSRRADCERATVLFVRDVVLAWSRVFVLRLFWVLLADRDQRHLVRAFRDQNSPVIS